MQETFFKLGEYKIIESDTGELRWEAHFGLGGLQEGKCFRKGTILFIGPAESQGDGFLKLEFVDHLKGFPDWLKTTYYCENLEVFHCKTGNKVSREEMRLWMFDQGREGETRLFSGKRGDGSDHLSSLTSKESVEFQLQRYEINKKANGQIVWKTYEGPSSLRTGPCRMLEDILFIGPWQDEQTDLTKVQFFANLKQLPEWNQTRYFCPKLSLHDCSSGNRILEKKKGLRRKTTAKETPDIRDEFKNITEIKIPEGPQPEIFSARISPIFDSLANSAAGSWKKARFFRFKFKKPDISKNMAILRTPLIRKWIPYAVALIFLIISLLFAFLIGAWKELNERWHHKKHDHSSTHHKGH